MRPADATSGTVSGNVAIGEGDSGNLNPLTINVTPNQAFNGVVATFTDQGNPSQTAGDWSATIDWGDGTNSAGTVSGSTGGPFSISGSHTYAATESGLDTALVAKFSDDAPSILTNIPINSTVIVGFLGQLAALSPIEGTALAANTTVATFTDADAGDIAGDFAATIDWGDGVTSTGTVVVSGGTVTIEGGHTYADEGNYTATASLKRTTDNDQGTVTGSITVKEGDSGNLNPVTLKIQPNQAFSGVVATFTDNDPQQVASDWSATIDWGDGTSSAATVSGSIGGPFSISGNHTYASTASGLHTNVVASFSDDAPSLLSNIHINSPLSVGFAGQFAPLSVIETIPLAANTTVATFADSQSGDTAGDFTATIDWGDGVTTAGTILVSNGTVTIDGGHTYAVDGSYQATATLTRTADNDQSSVSGTITVAERETTPDDFSGSGLSGVLWRQSPSNTLVEWAVNGSSIVSTQPTALGVPILPDQSWREVATADFNGDGRSDILWQHNDGSLADWTMNGSTISASNVVQTARGATIAPDASWSIAGTGDFNGDSRADILWRDTNGALAEWSMNGPTVISSQSPSYQGQAVTVDSSWSVAAMGDFNDDGRQDVLWRNNNGSLSEWLMDGSTITSGQVVTSQGKAVTPDSSWSVAAVGDFDGDGTSDLLWKQSGTGSLMEWQMNGSQIAASQPITFQGKPVTPDASWSLVEIGDFDGDGKSDMLWRQGSTGQVNEWLMNGAQIVASNSLSSMADSSWQVLSKPTNFG